MPTDKLKIGLRAQDFHESLKATGPFGPKVFNVLNHANSQLPVNNVAAVNAGTLTSVVTTGRQMQFGARLSF